jgi:hypothetical protein
VRTLGYQWLEVVFGHATHRSRVPATSAHPPMHSAGAKRTDG